MKKTILGLAVLALMASCGGGSAEDVNVAEIDDACGCTSGLMTIANDILDEIGDKTEDELEADPELSEAMEPKFDKLEKLDKKCRKELNVTKDEMIACDAEIENVMKRYEEKF